MSEDQIKQSISYREQFVALCNEVKGIKKIFPAFYTMGQLVSKFKGSHGSFAQYVYYLCSVGFCKKEDRRGTCFYTFITEFDEVKKGLTESIVATENELLIGHQVLQKLKTIMFQLECELNPPLVEIPNVSQVKVVKHVKPKKSKKDVKD